MNLEAVKRSETNGLVAELAMNGRELRLLV